MVGGGQAGLAMGYYLARQGRKLLILDRAPAVGHSWRTRYDSLKLFTPARYGLHPASTFWACPGSTPGVPPCWAGWRPTPPTWLRS
ncbi:MAG TPA: NAD(P)-binding protein [Symbiobacteriaceae bacterium]|nr:NAD(P)-binding protein [Symbiobacteriaceae bacterium]